MGVSSCFGVNKNSQIQTTSSKMTSLGGMVSTALTIEKMLVPTNCGYDRSLALTWAANSVLC